MTITTTIRPLLYGLFTGLIIGGIHQLLPLSHHGEPEQHQHIDQHEPCPPADDTTVIT